MGQPTRLQIPVITPVPKVLPSPSPNHRPPILNEESKNILSSLEALKNNILRTYKENLSQVKLGHSSSITKIPERNKLSIPSGSPASNLKVEDSKSKNISRHNFINSKTQSLSRPTLPPRRPNVSLAQNQDLPKQDLKRKTATPQQRMSIFSF